MLLIALGLNIMGNSIFTYGDVSTCSFHATKLFHTGEGGAMFSSNDELNEKLFYGHNFGHKGQISFQGLGINGKISELQAAMGLAVLPYMDEIIRSRKLVVEFYQDILKNSSICKFRLRENTEWNYSYFPVIFDSEDQLISVLSKFNSNNIFPRRYFYPSLNTIDYTNGKSMPISESVSKRILCLPLYVGLKKENLKLIVEIIINTINQNGKNR